MSIDDEPPKPTGNVGATNIAGSLIPWRDDNPVLMRSFGSDSEYLPLFDSEDLLKAFMTRSGIPYSSIKEIDDPALFMKEIPPEILIAVNPRYTEEGRVRWFQLARTAEDLNVFGKLEELSKLTQEFGGYDKEFKN